MATLILKPGALTLDDIQAIHAGGVQVTIDKSADAAIAAGAAVVRRAAEGDAAVYGVNTGFGKLASTRISRDDLATLITLEEGKPLAEARGEIDYAASFLQWFAEEAKRVRGDVIPAPRDTQRIVVL